MTTQPLRQTYQLKITLKHIKPPIWRRFLVDSTTKLEDMHNIIQAVMGWAGAHLHEFAAAGERYGEPDEDFPELNLKEERSYRLNQLVKKEKDKMTYLYDYGDGWEHNILLEKILPFDPNVLLPLCLKGKRACPPEDVGGPPGYEDFLQILANPAHPEHKESPGWVDGEFDPEDCNLDRINWILGHGEPLVEDDSAPTLEDVLDYLDFVLSDRIPEDEDLEGKDEGIINVSAMDGFLTAIVSGPSLVQPSRWLPVLWGDFEPEFETSDDFTAFMSLVINHMNSIVYFLMEQPDELMPIFYERVVDGEQHLIVDEWCEGFMRGVNLTAKDWHLEDDRIKKMLAPIVAFTQAGNWTGHDDEPEAVEQLQRSIIPNVQEVHAYWLARR